MPNAWPPSQILFLVREKRERNWPSKVPSQIKFFAFILSFGLFLDFEQTSWASTTICPTHQRAQIGLKAEWTGQTSEKASSPRIEVNHDLITTYYYTRCCKAQIYFHAPVFFFVLTVSGVQPAYFHLNKFPPRSDQM